MRIKFLAILICLTLPGLSLAEMSSQNYSIDSDTVNSGGTPSGSANYNSTGTMGEQAIGESGSASYGDKAGFWYMGKSAGLGLSCNSSNVYMVDYTLGNANNYSKHLFSTSEKCVVTDNSSAPWSLTASSSNMTSAKNNLPNSSIFLATDGTAASGDTITSPATNITEPAGPEYALNSVRTVISGDASANGAYNNQPTLKITDLNSLYDENLTGTLTITLQ